MLRTETGLGWVKWSSSASTLMSTSFLGKKAAIFAPSTSLNPGLKPKIYKAFGRFQKDLEVTVVGNSNDQLKKMDGDTEVMPKVTTARVQIRLIS